jgi:hypothetical protein
MFKTITNLADTLNYWVNRADYIFKLVNWSIDTVRIVADRLRTFPSPVNDNESSTNQNHESPNGVGTGVEKTIEPNPVRE